MTAAAAPIAGYLVVLYSAAMISSVGLALMAAGLLLIMLLPADPSYWDIRWRLALCGIGFGLFQTPNNTAMMTAGPIERSGAASGMNAVARYAGWTLGSAMVALIFALAEANGTAICLAAAAGFSAVGAIISLARRFAHRGRPI